MEPQTSRNAPCWCGSGRRYKHCHGAQPAPGADATLTPAPVAGPAGYAPGAAPRDEALAAHRAGRLGRAEELYRQAFATNPGDVDVLHMLGVVQLQRLRHREALDLLLDAAERTGWNVPAIRHNLGLAVAKLIAHEANARQAELVELSVALERERASTRGEGEPLVSVVIWYDGASSGAGGARTAIGTSVASTLAQTYRRLDVVIVADAPDDVMARQYAPELEARGITATVVAGVDEAGTAIALNRAVAAARGEFVAFLHAGDSQAPDRIGELVDAVARRRGRWGFSLVAGAGTAPEPPAPGLLASRAVDVTTRQRIALGTPPASFALVEADVTMVPGNLFVSRAWFVDAGGFVGRTSHWHWESCLRFASLDEPVVVDRPLYLASAAAIASAAGRGIEAIRAGALAGAAAAPRAAANDADVAEAARALGAFLESALVASEAVNPLAPQHPANRLALLKLVFRANFGALIPAAALRAFAQDARARAGTVAFGAPGRREAGGAGRAAIVVLGMHRSGTSAVARVINLCGAELPVHVKPARLGVNAKGFWEPEAVLELDTRLMQQLGGDWNRVDFVLPDVGAAVDEFAEDARGVLAAEYGASSLILIKDPRIGVLAPLWERVLCGAGYRTAWVVPVRNPLEVAQSLHARGDMGVREGLALWLAYMRSIADFSRGRNDVAFFTYGELLADWRAVIARVARKLAVPLDTAIRAGEVDDFLDRGMRHHVAADSSLASLPDEPLFRDVREMYRECLARCASDAADDTGRRTTADLDIAVADDRSAEPDPAFVLCIENNGLREQALLLCESVRRFGGRQRNARIVAFAPRPGMGVDRETRARLADLTVDYVDEPLNVSCPAYGPANRVFAGAFAERNLDSEAIAVLDSDTLVLEEIILPADCDAVVRVVDEKGSATRGPGDPFEPYWERMASIAGIALDRLPRVRTTITGASIRASYNAGFAVVRRSAGILGRCADVFAASLDAGWRPYAGSGIAIHASTGEVGSEGSEFWGSSQTALALAIWASTGRVLHASDRYNVPLHLIASDSDIHPRWLREPPVHVHYHWMFGPRTCEVALELLARLGVRAEALGWIGSRLPLAGE